MRTATAARSRIFLAAIAISLHSASVGRCQSLPFANGTPTPTRVPGLTRLPPAQLTNGLPDWWYKLPDKPEHPAPIASAGTHNLTVPNRKCLFLIDYALRVAHHPMPTTNAACASQMTQAFWYDANDPRPTPLPTAEPRLQ
jgi:hypothetical protein